MELGHIGDFLKQFRERTIFDLSDFLDIEEPTVGYNPVDSSGV